MEYLAKILHQQKTGNKNVWKIAFWDVEKDRKDWFLNNYPINYIPNFAGKLNLIESDKHPKFYEDFEQDVDSVDEKLFQQDTTIQLRRDLEKDVEKTEKKLAKKRAKLIERAEYLIGLRTGKKEKKYTQKDIAIVRGKSTRTIRRQEKPNLVFHKVGRKSIMTNYDLLLLMSSVFKEPRTTQEERANYIHKKTDRQYSQQIISLNLKRLGLPRKVIPYRYSQQKALMLEYWKFVSEIVPSLPPHRLLSLDESGFSTNLALRHGYAPTWNRVQADKPGRGTNYSLIALIHNVEKNGVIHAEIVEGAVDTEILYNFLLNVKLPTDEVYYLLMDNIKFHKNEKIKELLKQKNIIPIYIVAYFPQLNPVEWFFNTVKHYVKKLKPRTEDTLFDVLAGIISEFQKEDMTKYFKNCLDFKID